MTPALWTPDGRSLGMLLLAVFAVIMLVKLFVINEAHFATPDSEAYMKIAENILENNCVSLSLPESGDCVPHQGWHFPGIAAITAAFWFLFGKSYENALIIQALAVAISCTRLSYAVFSVSGSKIAAAVPGVSVALFPVYLIYSAHLLTESYSIASSAWIMAELMLCWRYQRLRIGWLAAALVFAVFMRLDGILLSLFVPLLAIKLHPFRQAVYRTFLTAVLVTIPVTGWMLRNVAHGLPPVLAYMTMDGAPMPAGYMSWINHFVTNMGGTNYWVHAVASYEYSRFNNASPATDVFIDDYERQRFTELRDLLIAASENKPMPPDIDLAFAELAQRRGEIQPIFHRAVIIGSRAWALWMQNPLYNYQWTDVNKEFYTKLILAEQTGQYWTLIKDEWPKLTVLALIIISRWALLAGFLALLPFYRKLPPPLAMFFQWTLAYMIIKTILVALSPVVHLRYMIAVFPFMEMAIILGAAHFWAARKRNAIPAHGHIVNTLE